MLACFAEAKGLGHDSTALGTLGHGSHLGVLIADVMPALAVPDPVDDLQACRQQHLVEVVLRCVACAAFKLHPTFVLLRGTTESPGWLGC